MRTCPLTAINFSDSSGATLINWDFGDGSPLSAFKNPTHVYANLGSYTVKLVVNNNGCVDSTIKTNYINSKTNARKKRKRLRIFEVGGGSGTNALNIINYTAG